MKRVTVVLLSIILLFVSCNVEPKMCIVTVDDGAGDRTELRIVAGSEFLIEAKTRDGYRIASIQDQNGKAYEVGNKIEITSDISITYSWEIYTSSSDFSWQFYEGQVIAGEYLGTSDVVKVPDKINGKAVTGIGRSAFYGHATMRKVIIPDSVIFIGSDAFYGCQSLEQINLPAEIQYLMNGAFDGCSGIKEINIPSSVVEISANVFNEWTADQTIVMGENISATALVNDWNRGCTANIIWMGDAHNWVFTENEDNVVITGYRGTSPDIVIPSYLVGKPVVEVGECAFENNDNINSVILPDTLLIISDAAFKNCDNLKEVIFPESLRTISKNAFWECTKLDTVDFSKAKNLVTIDGLAFYGCKALNAVTLPENLRTIGDRAFDYCSIKNIHIPANVNSIGECAFASKYLEVITVNPENQYFYSKGNCLINAQNVIVAGTSLSVIPTDQEISTIGKLAFAFTGIKEFEIPENITTIKAWAFNGCSSLEKVSLSKNVVNIEINPFTSCYNLISISVDNANPVYHSDGNALIETGARILVSGCKNTVIPTNDSVAVIGDSAFEGCNLTSNFSIPSNITRIGIYAFRRCRMNTITIPRTILHVDRFAFSNWLDNQNIRIENGAPVSLWDNNWCYEQFYDMNGIHHEQKIRANIVYL